MRRKLSILIIDDDEDFARQCHERLLKESGGLYLVDYTLNGAEGLAQAASGRYDVAIVDMKMPDMDGMEVLRRLRDLELRTIPIVLTGYSDVQNAVEAMRIGAADFVTKPLSAADLIKHIEKALTAREMALWYRERVRQIPPRDRSVAPDRELLQCLQAVTRDGRHLAAVFLGDLITSDSKTARRLKSTFKEQRISVHLITGRNMVSGKDIIRYLTSNDAVVIVSAIDIAQLSPNDLSLPRLNFSEILAESSRLGLSTKVSFVKVDPDNPNLDLIFRELL